MSGAVISRLCRILICVLLSLAGTHCKAAPIRIAAWNTANRPNDAKDEQAFRTVLRAIGPLDVLAVSESDAGSSQALATLMNDVYSVDSFGVTTSSSDAGGDRTGFLFNTDTVSLGQVTELNVGLTHNILSGQFQAMGTTKDIVIYSVHLKSGDGDAATTREAEAELIRNHADSLGDGVNVLFAGDFNMQGSSELAWTHMTADGNAQANDVANAPGDWRDNVDFLSLHTQEPWPKHGRSI